jgi:hypothetical protein
MRVAIAVLVILIVGLGGYLAFVQWWPSGTGSIWVYSDPPGAQVWLDLKPTAAVTNGLLGEVATGQHSVTVRLDTLQCDPVASVVFVHRHTTDTVRFMLVSSGFGAPAQVDRKNVSGLPPMPPAPPEPGPNLPTADELRRLAESADTTSRNPHIPIEHKTDLSGPLVTSGTPAQTGVIEVSSTLLQSQVYVNDELQPVTTPARLTLPEGSYIIRVDRPGYSPDPKEQTVRVTRGALPQNVFFTLRETAQVQRQFTVTTTPVSGKIFVDTVLVGEGSAIVPRDFGVFMVTFGDVDGYKTPDPIRVSLTPGKPRQNIQGVYVRILHFAAGVDSAGTVASEGNIRWSTGVFFEDGGAQPSASMGPKIKKIPDSGIMGWELAQGDPTRNPTGGDYLEFDFTLPPDVPPTSPLGLRLYLYRSSQRYPLALTARSEVVVTVNGKIFLDGYRPVYGTDAAGSHRYEEWSLQGMLKTGENRIMVRSGERNTQVNYLWKVEVL